MPTLLSKMLSKKYFNFFSSTSILSQHIFNLCHNYKFIYIFFTICKILEGRDIYSTFFSISAFRIVQISIIIFGSFEIISNSSKSHNTIRSGFIIDLCYFVILQCLLKVLHNYIFIWKILDYFSNNWQGKRGEPQVTQSFTLFFTTRSKHNIQVAHFINQFLIIHKYRLIYNTLGPLPTKCSIKTEQPRSWDQAEKWYVYVCVCVCVSVAGQYKILIFMCSPILFPFPHSKQVTRSSGSIIYGRSMEDLKAKALRTVRETGKQPAKPNLPKLEKCSATPGIVVI